MIARGCTCKNVFSIPFDGGNIEKLFITYQQGGKMVLEKELADCEFSDGTVSVELSQEDTLVFVHGVVIKIQIRVKLKDGTVTKSNIIDTYADQILKNEVI